MGEAFLRSEFDCDAQNALISRCVNYGNYEITLEWNVSNARAVFSGHRILQFHKQVCVIHKIYTIVGHRSIKSSNKGPGYHSIT